jgi:hypothetical protein
MGNRTVATAVNSNAPMRPRPSEYLGRPTTSVG